MNGYHAAPQKKISRETDAEGKNRPHPPNGVPFREGVFAQLIPELQFAITAKKFNRPTPVQEQSIPPILAGRDLLGSAQTGTGKTAAFVLPLLQMLTLDKSAARRIRPYALVLAPTRELAVQTAAAVAQYGRHLRLYHAVAFGGVKQHDQVKALGRGVHILVATPGRLLDLIRQGYCKLDAVGMFVLDEADRMLDMGFIPDIRKIVDMLPTRRQTLFFSATLPPAIMELARSLVHHAVEVAITPEAPVVEGIRQTVCYVDPARKFRLLLSMLQDTGLARVIVFVRLKHTADRIAAQLQKAGEGVEAIHSNKSQTARTRILDNFKRGKVRVLVATDVAARGLDIDRVSHVVNFDLPEEPENYVHRIGRTARAGERGDAVSFCSAGEKRYLRQMEKFIGMPIPVRKEQPFHSDIAMTAPVAARKKKPVPVDRANDTRRLVKIISYSGGRKPQGGNKGKRFPKKND